MVSRLTTAFVDQPMKAGKGAKNWGPSPARLAIVQYHLSVSYARLK